MSNEIDFDQLIDLLDRALTSNDPKVMRALKKFLFIAALATEDTEEEGPFANLIKRLEAVESQVASQPFQTYPSPTYPGTGYPGGGSSPMWYNHGTGGGTTTTTAISGNTHQYIPNTTTSGYCFTDDDTYNANFFTTPTSVTIDMSAQYQIDQALADLDKMADDELAK